MQLFLVNRVGMLIVVLVMLMGGIAFADSSDIDNHWSNEILQEWLDKRFIHGYTDGSFRPDKPITRAEFVTIVNKVFGFHTESEVHFDDVSTDAWYYKDISIGYAVGYIRGVSDDQMQPDRLISREEAAVILDRIMDEEGSGDAVNYADAEQFSTWSISEISRMTAAGYIKGYADQTFKPKQTISRAETVVMLSRAAGEIYPSPGLYRDQVIEGNVTITTEDVHLQNVVIKGNLYVTEGVREGDVILENITVEGITTISGGGENSVYVTGNSTFNEVHINKKTGNIRIVLRDESKLEMLHIWSESRIVNEAGVSAIGNLHVRIQENKTVELTGDFEDISIETTHTLVRLLSGIITKLTISEGSEGSDIYLDDQSAVALLIAYSSANVSGEGEIDHAEIKSNGVVIDKAPKKLTWGEGNSAIIGGQLINEETENTAETGNAGEPNNGNVGGGGNTGGNGGGFVPISVSGVSLDIDTIQLRPIAGESAVLTASIQPENATNQTLIWSSNNEEVATVVNGVVTPHAPGTAVITVETADGGFTATSTIISQYMSRAEVNISEDDLPVIAGYSFGIMVTQAADEDEVPLNGSIDMTITAYDGDTAIELFDGVQTFTEGGPVWIHKLAVPNPTMYTLEILIDGVSEPQALEIEAVSVIDAVNSATTMDEIYRSLTILGIMHGEAFSSETFRMELMQAYINDFNASQPATPAEVQTRVNIVNDNADIEAAMAALEAAAATLLDNKGANIVALAQAEVDEVVSGVVVTIADASEHASIVANGDITYTAEPVTGSIVWAFNKGNGAEQTLNLTVEVPLVLTLLDARINAEGTQIILIFNKEMANPVDNIGQFVISVNSDGPGGGRTITAAELDETGMEIILTPSGDPIVLSENYPYGISLAFPVATVASWDGEFLALGTYLPGDHIMLIVQ